MTYKCNFEPSLTNGHWHNSQEEADRCISSWDKWNNPVKKEKAKWQGYGFIPHADINDRSFIN